MADSTNARMLDLTQIIAEKTKLVCSPPADDGQDAAEAVKKARLELIDATDELNNLAKDPKETLQSLAWSVGLRPSITILHFSLIFYSSRYSSSMCSSECIYLTIKTKIQQHITSFTLHYITRFNIAASVPEHDSISLNTLASLTKTNETTLQRVLRHCMLNYIFREPTKGLIAHTSTSLLLRTSPSSIAWASMMPDDYWPITTHAVDAIEKWPQSSEPTETAVTLAHGTDSFYLYLGKFPQKAARFGMAMTGFSSGPGLEFETLATSYPWHDLPADSTIVDIGSGIGFVSVAIAQAHPTLKFVCQDLPSTIAAAPEQIPSEVKDRITFQGHDFLTPNPVVGAAVYFFRFIFHNWSDVYCIRILQALIPALKPGSRILINDTALPEHGEMSRWEERTLRDLDMTMLTLLNAREREVAEFKMLFEKADKRFKWMGATLPPRSKMWEIEAVWEPEG